VKGREAVFYPGFKVWHESWAALRAVKRLKLTISPGFGIRLPLGN
jgi:hypothetical protein